MSFNPAALNLNPRIASQISMRYAAAAVAAQSHPRFPGQIRFPGMRQSALNLYRLVWIFSCLI